MSLFNFLKKHRKTEPSVSNIPEGAPAADCYRFQGTVDDYFLQLISACFPQLRVCTSQRMAGPEDVPVSFLLYQNGEPKLAVILCSSQEYRTRRVKNTVDACTARNIPVQRYYREFRNKASYVVDRIQSAL